MIRLCMMIDKLLHKWLKIPYVLHAKVTKPSHGKATATLLLIHGIGNSGKSWQSIAEQLPDNYNVVTIDLLGFGKSPKPTWGKYDVKQQSRAVLVTFLRLRITGKVVVVGHSLGALVGLEIAKRYPLLVSGLILCSPPFYRRDIMANKLLPAPEKVLKRIYRQAHSHPERFLQISKLAYKYNLLNKAFDLNDKNIHAYMGALETAIVNQTSYDDAMASNTPTRILYGSLDPLVVAGNLKRLSEHNQHISLMRVLASHEFNNRYETAVVAEIINMTKSA